MCVPDKLQMELSWMTCTGQGTPCALDLMGIHTFAGKCVMQAGMGVCVPDVFAEGLLPGAYNCTGHPDGAYCDVNGMSGMCISTGPYSVCVPSSIEGLLSLASALFSCSTDGAACSASGQTGTCVMVMGVGVCVPQSLTSLVPNSLRCPTAGATCYIEGVQGQCAALPGVSSPVCVPMPAPLQWFSCAGAGTPCTTGGPSELALTGTCRVERGLALCVPDVYALGVPESFRCNASWGACTVEGAPGNCVDAGVGLVCVPNPENMDQLFSCSGPGTSCSFVGQPGTCTTVALDMVSPPQSRTMCLPGGTTCPTPGAACTVEGEAGVCSRIPGTNLNTCLPTPPPLSYLTCPTTGAACTVEGMSGYCREPSPGLKVCVPELYSLGLGVFACNSSHRDCSIEGYPGTCEHLPELNTSFCLPHNTWDPNSYVRPLLECRGSGTQCTILGAPGACTYMDGLPFDVCVPTMASTCATPWGQCVVSDMSGMCVPMPDGTQQCIPVPPTPAVLSCSGQGVPCMVEGMEGTCVYNEATGGMCMPNLYKLGLPPALKCNGSSTCTIDGMPGMCMDARPELPFSICVPSSIDSLVDALRCQPGRPCRLMGEPGRCVVADDSLPVCLPDALTGECRLPGAPCLVLGMQAGICTDLPFLGLTCVDRKPEADRNRPAAPPPAASRPPLKDLTFTQELFASSSALTSKLESKFALPVNKLTKIDQLVCFCQGVLQGGALRIGMFHKGWQVAVLLQEVSSAMPLHDQLVGPGQYWRPVFAGRGQVSLG